MNQRNPSAIGIDLGKNHLHLAAIDGNGNILRRRRLNRLQLSELATTFPTCTIGMEACPGSQFWGRRFNEAGHRVRIMPAQFVKPYAKSEQE